MLGKDVNGNGGDDGWVAWRNYVLEAIKEINENVSKLAESDTAIRIDIAKLKLCAAIWGGIAGVIAGVIATIFVGLVIKLI